MFSDFGEVLLRKHFQCQLEHKELVPVEPVLVFIYALEYCSKRNLGGRKLSLNEFLTTKKNQEGVP